MEAELECADYTDWSQPMRKLRCRYVRFTNRRNKDRPDDFAHHGTSTLCPHIDPLRD